MKSIKILILKGQFVKIYCVHLTVCHHRDSVSTQSHLCSHWTRWEGLHPGHEDSFSVCVNTITPQHDIIRYCNKGNGVDLLWRRLKYQSFHRRNLDGLWQFCHRRAWKILNLITDSNCWKEPLCVGEENLPQIYSANKFPKDLSSEHKHSPSCEVDTKYNANSARTHQVLPHICFEEMVQMC